MSLMCELDYSLRAYYNRLPLASATDTYMLLLGQPDIDLLLKLLELI